MDRVNLYRIIYVSQKGWRIEKYHSILFGLITWWEPHDWEPLTPKRAGYYTRRMEAYFRICRHDPGAFIQLRKHYKNNE